MTGPLYAALGVSAGLLAVAFAVMFGRDLRWTVDELCRRRRAERRRGLVRTWAP